MTTPYFHPPVVKEGPVAPGALFCRFKLYKGMTVLKNQDGTYSTVRYPSLDDLNNSQTYYQGGHIYPLSSQEVTSLTAAGYGANITYQ